MDMAPFFQRLESPGFAPGDFFTDQSVLPNPRWVFGAIVWSIAKLAHQDWTWVFAFLKSAQLVLAPFAFFLLLRKGLCRQLPHQADRRLATWVLALGLCAGLVGGSFWHWVYAWWPIIPLTATPQSLAFLLASLGALLWGAFPLAGIGLGAIATLIHPIAGAMVTSFAWLLLSPRRFQGWRSAGLFVGAILLPMAGLALAFSSESGLSSAEWVYHYCVVGHPFHYVPSEWAAFSGGPGWPWTMAWLGLGSVTAATFGAVKGARRFSAWALGLGLLVPLAVLLQWLSVEVYPTKAVALFGPSRLVSLGPWIFWVCVGGAAGLVGGRRTEPLPAWGASITALGLILGAWLWLLPRADDRHIQYFRAWFGELRQELQHWPASSTVAVPPDGIWRYELMITGRPQYFSYGFAFREAGFKEQTERRCRLYGCPEDHVVAGLTHLPPPAREAEFYRRLTPKDFVAAADRYRLDLVVVKKGQFGDSIKPYRRLKALEIFTTNQLRNFVAKGSVIKRP